LTTVPAGYKWGHPTPPTRPVPPMALTLTDVKKARPTDRPVKLFDGKGLYSWSSRTAANCGGSSTAAGRREDAIDRRVPRLRPRGGARGTHPGAQAAQGRHRPEREEAGRARDEGDTFRRRRRRVAAEQSHLAADTSSSSAPGSSRTSTGDRREAGPRAHRADLLEALRRVELKGKHETAHRARALAGRVMRLCRRHGPGRPRPSADLKGALTPVRGKHHAAVTDPKDVGDLLRALDSYAGQASTTAPCAGAARVRAPWRAAHAEWSEFDLDAAEWRIPGRK